MINMSRLDSATKYPSILTYHELDPKNGNLLEKPTVFTGNVILTEKVNGTNGRIVLLPGGDYFIGSREELLYARGDRIQNPELSIVPTLKPLADQIVHGGAIPAITALYLEVYGDKIGGAAKQYTTNGGCGYRMFDASEVAPETLAWPCERIASWRDRGGQMFYNEDELQSLADSGDIPVTPRLATIPAEELPTTVEHMHEWLKVALPNTLVKLDPNAAGNAEGIVLRTEDRSIIAKARFQDYQRTLKRRADQPKKR